MKKILISFLISLFFNTYALSIEKIYYCIEIGATGFNITKNYEQQDPRNYSYDDPVQSQLNELDNMLDDDSQWD